METINQDIVERISKLLKLAENNPNAGEREKALLLAKRLAQQNELDLAQIDKEKWENTNLRKEILREDIELGKRASVCQKYSSWILMHHFNVKLINTGSRRFGKELVMIGRKSDVEIGKYVQSFLNNEIMRLWHEYKRLNNVRTVERGSFMYGVYKGLDDKLKASKDKFEAEKINQIKEERGEQAATQTVNNLSLMRITDGERINSFVSKEFPSLRSVRSYARTTHVQSAMDAGYVKGKVISLRRGLGNSSHLVE